MLVRPRGCGIHGHVPGDQPGRIRPGLQGRQDLPPGPVPLPAAEQAIHRRPRPVGRRHVPPRRTSPHPPPDPVNELPFRPFRRAPRLPATRQQRLQPAHCASVRSARPVTVKVATRSPCRWSSSSLTHLPETSSVTAQRHAGNARSHHATQPTFETRPSCVEIRANDATGWARSVLRRQWLPVSGCAAR